MTLDPEILEKIHKSLTPEMRREMRQLALEKMGKLKNNSQTQNNTESTSQGLQKEVNNVKRNPYRDMTKEEFEQRQERLAQEVNQMSKEEKDWLLSRFMRHPHTEKTQPEEQEKYTDA